MNKAAVGNMQGSSQYMLEVVDTVCLKTDDNVHSGSGNLALLVGKVSSFLCQGFLDIICEK